VIVVLVDGTAVRPARALGAGPGSRRPAVIGVETVRADGNPTVFHSGSKSNNPITTTCNPNEVSVIPLRRARWAHEVSSRLSANMVSSHGEICLLLWTPDMNPQMQLAQRKKAALLRGRLELLGH
jgi:hypothetical protein